MHKPTLQVVNSSVPALTTDGSRFIPGVGVEATYTHWARYLFAAQYVAGRSVLDVGCGEGYGADVLAASAREVSAFDIDEVAIQHARRRYGTGRPNLSFSRASVAEFARDAKPGSVDVVTAFEVLEYLGEDEQRTLFATVARVLKPDGVAIFSASTGVDHRRDAHLVRPLSRPELDQLARAHFAQAEVFEQATFTGAGVFGTSDREVAPRFIDWTHRVDLRARMRAQPATAARPVVLMVSHAPLPVERQGLALFDDAQKLLAAEHAELERKLAHVTRQLRELGEQRPDDEMAQRAAALSATVDILTERFGAVREAQSMRRHLEHDNATLRRQLDHERLRINHLENMLAVKVAMVMKASLDRVPLARETLRKALMFLVG